MRYLLDNWWLLFLLYGIWKAVTKKAGEAKRVAEIAAADARRALGVAEADEEASEAEAASVYLEEAAAAYARRKRLESDFPVEVYKERATAEVVVDRPVAEDSFQDESAQRMDASERDEAIDDARRQMQDNLRRVYSIPTLAETAQLRTSQLGVTPDEIRRAIILTEILQPPRSRRPHR